MWPPVFFARVPASRVQVKKSESKIGPTIVCKNYFIEHLLPVYRRATEDELKLCQGDCKYGSFFILIPTTLNAVWEFDEILFAMTNETKGVIYLIKSQNAFYKACPQPECNKKMNIGDWTSNRWVTVFSDLAEQLLGRSA
uniref:Uncharacterized protein n=1 Tax=Glossina austeni TaxID=7395 RepID=A0A1A9VGL8_GLOAU